MKDIAILYPLFALAGWTFLMAVFMLRTAFKAVGEGLSVEYFRYGSGAEPPGYMRAAYQQYTNLFEMPVLFYAVGVLTYVTEQATSLLLGLAWAYVGMRMAHSVLHLRNTNVPRRRDAYLLSAVLLMTMWGVLFFNIVATGA